MNKFWVAGYYVEGLDIDTKGLALTEAKIYTTEEILASGAVEGCKDKYEEETEKDFTLDATEEEAIKYIEEYTYTDEIFHCIGFETEEKAKKYIKELEENKKRY